MDDFDQDDFGAGRVGGRVLNAATNRLAAAYHDLFGRDLIISGATPRKRHDGALAEFKRAVSEHKSPPSEVLKALDPEHEANEASASCFPSESDAVNTMVRRALVGLDYVSPAHFKDVLWRVCVSRCLGSINRVVRVNLADLLREVYKILGDECSWKRRVNVVAGENFSRALQWTRECSDEWVTDDGQSALRLINKGGGAVAAFPDPKRVDVMLRSDYFKE